MLKDEYKIFFARSRLRITVLNKLSQKPQIATFLARDMKKHREVISRIFSDLQKEKLVECKNPKDPHFRYYGITTKGKRILKEIKQDYQKPD